MNKLIVLFFVVILNSSCEKENLFHKDRKSKPCPSVNSETVPSKVKDAFTKKYPSAADEKWFSKNSSSYAVSFKQGNSPTSVAQFDTDGNFEQEGENQSGQNNDHQDGDEKECGCELEHGD